MGVQYTPESGHAKEMAKYEQRPTPEVPSPLTRAQGGNYPYQYEEFPKMLFRAERRPTGPPKIAGYIEAGNEHEQDRYLGEGWSKTQEDALAAIAREDTMIAELAANRAFNERTMGERARAEAAAADEATAKHLPSVPETPIRRTARS